eukprot:290178_1
MSQRSERIISDAEEKEQEEQYSQYSQEGQRQSGVVLSPDISQNQSQNQHFLAQTLFRTPPRNTSHNISSFQSPIYSSQNSSTTFLSQHSSGSNNTRSSIRSSSSRSMKLTDDGDFALDSEDEST